VRKIKTIKGMVIAFDKKLNEYSVFSREEWEYGAGCRYPEYDGMATMAEAEGKARGCGNG